MAAFDVIVVGGADPSPDASRKLTTSLATRLGLPVPSVARALAGKKLTAGRNMDQGTAQNLAQELQRLGALVDVRPATAGPPSMTMQKPAGLPPPPPAGRPAAPARTVHGAAPAAPHDPFAPPPSQPNIDFFATAAPSAPKASARDPFAPPADAGGEFGLELAVTESPKAAASKGPPRSSFAPPADDNDAPTLELDQGPATSSAEMRQHKRRNTVSGASAMNLDNMSATSSASGLAMNEDAGGGTYQVRCSAHGMLYDKRKASGCRKCLSGGRKMAATFESKLPFSLGEFESAARRAFIGLAAALIIGLLPAAYHAFRVGAKDIRRMRDEQELISRKPATEDSLRRFDELDEDVNNAHSHAMRNTAVIWLMTSTGAMFAWFRSTTVA